MYSTVPYLIWRPLRPLSNLWTVKSGLGQINKLWSGQWGKLTSWLGWVSSKFCEYILNLQFLIHSSSAWDLLGALAGDLNSRGLFKGYVYLEGTRTFGVFHVEPIICVLFIPLKFTLTELPLFHQITKGSHPIAHPQDLVSSTNHCLGRHGTLNRSWRMNNKYH